MPPLLSGAPVHSRHTAYSHPKSAAVPISERRMPSPDWPNVSPQDPYFEPRETSSIRPGDSVAASMDRSAFEQNLKTFPSVKPVPAPPRADYRKRITAPTVENKPENSRRLQYSQGSNDTFEREEEDPWTQTGGSPPAQGYSIEN